MGKLQQLGNRPLVLCGDSRWWCHLEDAQATLLTALTSGGGASAIDETLQEQVCLLRRAFLLLQAVTGEDNADGRITDRLAVHAAARGDLDAWLSRFASLRHAIPAAGTLAEVAEGATAVAEGILRAKQAAAAAKVRDLDAREQSLKWVAVLDCFRLATGPAREACHYCQRGQRSPALAASLHSVLQLWQGAINMCPSDSCCCHELDWCLQCTVLS